EVEPAQLEREEARLDASEVEELLDHRQHPVGLLADALDDAALLRRPPGELAAPRQHLAVRLDDRDRRLELVRHDRQELLPRGGARLVALDLRVPQQQADALGLLSTSARLYGTPAA